MFPSMAATPMCSDPLLARYGNLAARILAVVETGVPTSIDAPDEVRQLLADAADRLARHVARAPPAPAREDLDDACAAIWITTRLPTSD